MKDAIRYYYSCQTSYKEIFLVLRRHATLCAFLTDLQTWRYIDNYLMLVGKSVITKDLADGG
jgi:hypothetical protein